jgi:hypothetical protein
LHPTIFKYNLKLVVLLLANNEINAVGPKVFFNLQNLNSLTMSKNPCYDDRYIPGNSIEDNMKNCYLNYQELSSNQTTERIEKDKSTERPVESSMWKEILLIIGLIIIILETAFIILWIFKSKSSKVEVNNTEIELPEVKVDDQSEPLAESA